MALSAVQGLRKWTSPPLHTSSHLFVHKRRLKKEKKIKKGESIHKITFSPIDLFANNTT